MLLDYPPLRLSCREGLSIAGQLSYIVTIAVLV